MEYYVVICSSFKGSYGRLGLGNSETQSSLKDINTFPENTLIQKIASSRGSDGHSLAIDKIGNVYSWGDGKFSHTHTHTHTRITLFKSPSYHLVVLSSWGVLVIPYYTISVAY